MKEGRSEHAPNGMKKRYCLLSTAWRGCKGTQPGTASILFLTRISPPSLRYSLRISVPKTGFSSYRSNRATCLWRVKPSGTVQTNTQPAEHMDTQSQLKCCLSLLESAKQHHHHTPQACCCCSAQGCILVTHYEAEQIPHIPDAVETAQCLIHAYQTKPNYSSINFKVRD